MASSTILITQTRKITPAMPLLISTTTANMANVTTTDQPVRKRQRLTHLTPEEKFMRRKLKNRVAAQTARDRKKAHVETIQSKVSQLEAKNKHLSLNNQALRKQSSALIEENKTLKAQLRLHQNSTIEIKQEKDCKDSTLCKLERDGCESAEGTHPDSVQLVGNAALVESEFLLGLLEELNPEGFFEEKDGDGEFISNLIDGSKHDTVSEMVGSTTNQLESLNELIRFDHEYYKKPVICEQSADIATTVEMINRPPPPLLHVQTLIPDVVVDMETEPESDMSELFASSSSSDFDCGIKDLLSVDSVRSDSYSDSGISDSESSGFPASPLSDDWQETFTDLFPSLV